jgi:hypothetical protein
MFCEKGDAIYEIGRVRRSTTMFDADVNVDVLGGGDIGC